MDQFKQHLLHIRPRFSLEVNMPLEEVQHRLEEKLKRDTHQCIGSVMMDNVSLDLPLSEQHFWSPHMNFRMETPEDTPYKTLIKGIVGPRPVVWTMFMFFYFSVCAIGFFISIYGLSKWSLGVFSFTIFGFPIALIFMSTAYISGKYGEKLGHDQIDTLKDFVIEALEH